MSIYWLGVLAMLMGAFISCNAYFMPYYIYYSCTYIACDTWCTCHAYGGFYFLYSSFHNDRPVVHLHRPADCEIQERSL